MLAGFASSKKEEKICKKVSIKIANEFNNYFISEVEVEALLTREGVDALEGTITEKVSLKDLETKLKTHAFVKEAQVSKDLDGNLNVYIKQNRPIARLLHANQDVYIDQEGAILPLSEQFTARVVPITKSVGSPAFTTEFLQGPLGKPYMAFLQYIENDAFWKSQISQVHIDKKGRISFLPQVGDQVIEFGKPVEIEQKFRKLMIFYKKVLPVMGWDRYKRVNIEYQDQIICE
ncbi:MAG: hypothetical protein LPK19_09540 [Hymenobacteraceae bacterium]|nr:hypothetical protein [Hymenobacteraceae bacterium]MDX5396466.1 hypothetical protein [Hymenobacteraceae bacterium]MDX5512527.1 hypothetical protein [Hymenobacteraceae bacterium]